MNWKDMLEQGERRELADCGIVELDKSFLKHLEVRESLCLGQRRKLNEGGGVLCVGVGNGKQLLSTLFFSCLQKGTG